VLDKTGSLPVSFPVQIIYRIVRIAVKLVNTAGIRRSWTEFRQMASYGYNSFRHHQRL